MRTAKDENEFRKAWQSHIAQLGSLMLDSDAPYETWNRIRTELELHVERAITNQKLAELTRTVDKLRTAAAQRHA
jgi:hypothetical protein